MKVKCDHRSKFSNLSNWKEEAWKKNQDFNGIRIPLKSWFFFQASSFQLLKLENLLRWSHFTFNVRIIMNPKSVSRIFDFSLFLEIWRLHWKLCSRVLLSSLKDNNPKITNRKNTNPGHPFQVQNICRSRSDIKETCWLKCVVL